MTSPGGREVGRISIKVLPDVSRFRRELKAELEAVEKSTKVRIPVELDLDTNGIREKVKAATAGLDEKINVKLDVNHGLGRTLNQISSSAASASEGLVSVGRTGAIAFAVVAAAAPAVGLVSGLLAGLPSLMAAGGAGAGAIALGLDGIKASAASLTPQLDALKASVSSVFEQRLTPIFDQFKSVFAVLQVGMGQVANGLADMFQGVTNALTSGAGLSQLQHILSQTAGLFSAMQPVVQSFTSSFLTLASAGASALGKLLAPLQTFATQFGDVINRITSNGSFNGAMEGLSQTLGSVLNLFNRLFESGVQAMGQLGGPLSNLINGLGDAFIAAMPALTSFSAFLGNVLGSALTAIAPAITAITPAFTALANTLGTMLSTNLTSLAPVLTQIASAIGTTLLTAVQAIQPILPGLLQSFQQFATVLSGQLAQHLPGIAQSFGQLLAAVVPLTPMFLKLATEGLGVMLPALSSMIGPTAQILSLLASLATTVSNAAQAFLGGLDAVKAFATQGLAAVVTFAGSAVAEVTQLGPKFSAAVSNFGSLLVGAGKALIQGLINGIKSMVGAAISAATSIASQVAGAVKGALGINSPSKVFTEIGNQTMQGLQDGLEGGFVGVLERAKAIAQQLTDTINGGITGIDPDTLTDPLKRSLDELELQRKELKIQKDSIPKEDKDGRAAIQSQIDQINSLKKQLALQKDQLGFSEKYGESLDKNDDIMGQSVSKLIDAAKGFATANANQFMQDLGMSGNGAIPQVANQLLGWGSQMLSKLATGGFGNTSIQVNSIDEAIAFKNNQVNKQALQFHQR